MQMRIRNKYIIELDYEYDHESLLELYNRHECTPYKHQVTGKELGFSHCYTEYLFNEPVVQKIIADFSYLDLRFEFKVQGGMSWTWVARLLFVGCREIGGSSGNWQTGMSRANQNPRLDKDFKMKPETTNKPSIYDLW